jgi:hypothetical protein
VRLPKAFARQRQARCALPGSITTIHANSAALAFEQLTLPVKESEGGRDLARYNIRALLQVLVDVVVQIKRVDGRFRITEVWYEPVREREPTDPTPRPDRTRQAQSSGLRPVLSKVRASGGLLPIGKFQQDGRRPW